MTKFLSICLLFWILILAQLKLHGSQAIELDFWSRSWNRDLSFGDTIGILNYINSDDGDSIVSSIHAGGDYSLFLKIDGSLWGMGGNFAGQLGNGQAGGTEENFDEGIDLVSPVKFFTGIPSNFQFVSGEGDQDNQRFYIEGSLLKVNQTLSEPSGNSYSVRVRTTGTGIDFEQALTFQFDEVSPDEGQLFSQNGVFIGTGWKCIPWFEVYFPSSSSSRYYHGEMGWIYIPLNQRWDRLWLWHPQHNWLWTSADCFPWLYSNDRKNWMYFLSWKGKPWFYDYGLKIWIEEMGDIQVVFQTKYVLYCTISNSIIRALMQIF